MCDVLNHSAARVNYYLLDPKMSIDDRYTSTVVHRTHSRQT